MERHFTNYVAKRRPPDEEYMALALRAAEQARAVGDRPEGAALVWPGGLMVEADTSYTERDAGGHACLNVLRKASRTVRRSLADATLYVTAEPCEMCMAAVRVYGVREVVYGCDDPANGHRATAAEVTVKSGVLAEQCRAVIFAGKEATEHEGGKK